VLTNKTPTAQYPLSVLAAGKLHHRLRSDLHGYGTGDGAAAGGFAIFGRQIIRGIMQGAVKA
jgi:hypothetical protein